MREITQYTPPGSHPIWTRGNDVAKPVKVMKLRQAAYDAQLSAGLPVSDLAGAVLIVADGSISHRHCATYILAACAQNLLCDKTFGERIETSHNKF
jgi:hypothetical protein